MAQPARHEHRSTEAPPLDPGAVDRAYHLHRAKRHARSEHRRATRMARFRFWVVSALLILACLVLAVTIWDEVKRLFGI